jgi:hypothetical protein
LIDLDDAETIPRPTLIRYRDSLHDDGREQKTVAVVGLSPDHAPALADLLCVLEAYGGSLAELDSMADDLIAILRGLGH